MISYTDMTPGWLGFGGLIFTLSHLIFSTLGPGETAALQTPGPIPPYRGEAIAPDKVVTGVAAEIPSQPPPKY